MQLNPMALVDNLKNFDKLFVGFDDQFNKLSRLHDDLTRSIPNYPPYNIAKTGDNTYLIEIAVAGFGKSEIELELADNVLTIKGGTKSEEDNSTNYLFRGIANRAFTRTFALEDHIEVRDAELLNGMLRVFLERVIPDYKKPKRIEVREDGETKPKSKRQLLTEDK